MFEVQHSSSALRPSLCDGIKCALALAASLASSVALSGCGPAKKPVPYASTQPIVFERQLPMRAEPILIKRGPVPLVYLVDSSATLRFMDLTNSVELGRALVQPRQIVSIDADRGVCIGELVLHRGPLDVSHEYGMWLDPSGESSYRNSLINVPDRDPTSQPAGGQPARRDGSR